MKEDKEFLQRDQSIYQTVRNESEASTQTRFFSNAARKQFTSHGVFVAPEL